MTMGTLSKSMVIRLLAIALLMLGATRHWRRKTNSSNASCSSKVRSYGRSIAHSAITLAPAQSSPRRNGTSS